jgi:hypothetical protein
MPFLPALKRDGKKKIRQPAFLATDGSLPESLGVACASFFTHRCAR